MDTTLERASVRSNQRFQGALARIRCYVAVVSQTTVKASKAKAPPKPIELTGKERRAARALGHALSPVVQIGKAGLSKGVTQELQGALEAHELIKVQLLRECPLDRAEAADRITAATGASVVQTLGKVVLLYKPNPDQPKLSLEHPAPSADKVATKAKPPSKRARPTRANATRRSARLDGNERSAASRSRHAANRARKWGDKQ
jgi:RNA-binding protein